MSGEKIYHHGHYQTTKQRNEASKQHVSLQHKLNTNQQRLDLRLNIVLGLISPNLSLNLNPNLNLNELGANLNSNLFG